jgi:hypothetical protein
LYLVFLLGVGFALLFGVIALFKSNLLVRAYPLFFLIAGSAAIGLLFGARRVGKYRAGFVFLGLAMLAAIAGAAGGLLGVPDSIASAMTLWYVPLSFLGFRRLISAAQQSDSEGRVAHATGERDSPNQQ